MVHVPLDHYHLLEPLGQHPGRQQARHADAQNHSLVAVRIVPVPAPPRTEGSAMAFKLIESAQRRWRMVNAPHLVALRAGATFVNGKLVERPEDKAAEETQPEAA